MHIHILGICGTFMGGIAQLAKAAGHTVTGSDAHVYPPMSTQLEEAGITVLEGYDPSHLDPAPDQVVIGNAMSRGNPAVEYVLKQGLRYTSGPQWLAEHVLQDRWVLAVAGTHGKTTAASMLAWILEYAGLKPGFLIGGVPENFGVSARFGDAPFFVVEADEYDTAFFDKRSKFVHYHPRTLVMNNLEFDHADIFEDLDAIEKQFHHLVRTVPGNGLIIYPSQDEALQRVIQQGCWTPAETVFGASGLWQTQNATTDGSRFEVWCGDQKQDVVSWELVGNHNVNNAMVAIAAARHAGVPTKYAIEALGQFKSVKRRLETKGTVSGVVVYDDFAHHPTAIRLTLEGLRNKVGTARILAIMEPRSNTMKMGVHEKTLADAFAQADQVLLYRDPNLDWGWNLDETMQNASVPVVLHSKIEEIVEAAANWVRPDDHILVMSNGGFGGIHEKLLQRLQQTEAVQS